LNNKYLDGVLKKEKKRKKKSKEKMPLEVWAEE
jgi:hypothetical protein